MKPTILRLLSAVLILLLFSVLPLQGNAAEDASIRLSDADVSGGNLPFYAVNMFPGDSITQDYLIQVSHREPVQLHYHADIRPGYETLAEVLMIAISLPEKGVVLYDGLMRDMPASVTHTLEAGEDSLRYRITVSLPTSAGNRYQNQGLIADFRWWYLEEIPPVSVKLAAEKTLNGQYARGDDFSFQLRAEDGTLVQTVRNHDGVIDFDSLTFTAPGTYRYTLTELPGSSGNLIYDAAVYQVTVTVHADMTASLTYTRNGEPYTALPRFANRTRDYGGTDDTPTNPKTADTFPLTGLSLLCAGSFLGLLILLLKKRKEDQHGRA